VIVDYLVQEKVPQVFGLCGHGNIQFIDALYERSSDIKDHFGASRKRRRVHGRRLLSVSGRPTATFTSCGPGSAIADLARQCVSRFGAVLAVTANVPTSQFNRGAFQELYRHYQADFPSTVRSYARRCSSRLRGEMVPLAIRQAWKTMMTGRPGPWCWMCRFDVFMESAAERRRTLLPGTATSRAAAGADPEGVVKAVDMLLGAERPVMIVGQGVRYGGACRGIAKTRRTPANSGGGIRQRSWRHRHQDPLALGLVARAGHYQANHATRQADVLLAMGMRFDDRTSSSWIPGYSFTIPPTKLIHVDIDPEEIGRNIRSRSG